MAALIHAACYLLATPLFQKKTGRELQTSLSSSNEDAIQVRWGSAGDRVALLKINKKPPKGFKTPLEASHHHFLVTPPSHFTPQKVEGFVVGLIGNGRESMAETLDHAENIVKGNFTHFIY